MLFYKSRVLMIALALFACASWADPAPIGLEIGKANLTDARARFKLTPAGSNDVTQGQNFTVPASAIDMSGLKIVTLMFDNQNVLRGVVFAFDKSRFEVLFDLLQKNYRLVESDLPFVGDKAAEFREGATKIIIFAAHLSFEMTLAYFDAEVFDRAMDASAREAQTKRNREATQLGVPARD